MGGEFRLHSSKNFQRKKYSRNAFCGWEVIGRAPKTSTILQQRGRRCQRCGEGAHAGERNSGAIVIPAESVHRENIYALTMGRAFLFTRVFARYVRKHHANKGTDLNERRTG